MEKFRIGLEVIKKLVENGFEGFFVGGFVRDYLLGRKVNDIDIATNAHPNNVMSIFEKTIPTGLKHGTVTVIIDGTPIEVTTYRTEGKYLDFRHPSNVQFVSNLIEDLSRRDFTINAMALDMKERIIDPFNGKGDLDNKKIKTVGIASDRFFEDPLRMLRAIRFASQLNFDIEEGTWEGILSVAPFMQHIALERVKAELDKIMKSVNSSLGINRLFQSKLIFHIKELQEVDLLKIENAKLIHLLSQTEDLFIRWFLLIKPIEEENRYRLMKTLRFSNKEISEINLLFHAYHILTAIKERTILKCIVETNDSACYKIVDILYLLKQISGERRKELKEQIANMNNSLDVKHVKDLDISGRDLIEYFNKDAGPWVKELLESLLSSVIYEGLPNEKKRLLEYAKNKVNK